MIRRDLIRIMTSDSELEFVKPQIQKKQANYRVNPLIDINLGALLWCGLGNCVIFGPVE